MQTLSPPEEALAANVLQKKIAETRERGYVYNAWIHVEGLADWNSRCSRDLK